MAETLNTRVTRLEKAMTEMAKAQTRLDNALAHLAEVQAQDESDIRQMKKEALEREKRIDERIEKLVIAIGELIHRNGKTK
jgi:predicted  nucleic acid-binding Zn-ribbon protein